MGSWRLSFQPKFKISASPRISAPSPRALFYKKVLRPQRVYMCLSFGRLHTRKWFLILNHEALHIDRHNGCMLGHTKRIRGKKNRSWPRILFFQPHPLPFIRPLRRLKDFVHHSSVILSPPILRSGIGRAFDRLSVPPSLPTWVIWSQMAAQGRGIWKLI